LIELKYKALFIHVLGIMMIKYITYMYITANGVAPINNMDYCETRNLQSPHVKKLDDSVEDNIKFIPINTCKIKSLTDDIDKKDALLRCIKTDTNWIKL
tara:strand:+ start:347 stop:643 length:297 start_codon:yes stop_codon:yes gene_type:complete